MKLKCVKDYVCRDLVYRRGQVFEVDDWLGEWLLRDGAGCIVPYAKEPEPEAKELDAPPANKMIESPPVKKTARRKRGEG